MLNQFEEQVRKADGQEEPPPPSEETQASKGNGNAQVSLDHVFDAQRMLDEYERYVQNLEKVNFKTGVRQIDQKIRGVAGGEVLTLIARAGCFKTATLQNMLKNYVQNSSLGAAFFSLEMPIAAVAERYHEIVSGYTGYEVEDAYRDKASHIDVLQRKFISELKALYVIPVRVSLAQVRDYVRLIEDHHKIKIGVIGIDYLGLLDGRGQNQYEIISRLARETKTLAKEISLPVVLLAQTSRRAGSGETEITLDMGRDSGVIEEGADFIIGLFQVEREDQNGEPEYDLVGKILKNRKGSRNSTWKLDLNPRTLYLESEAEPWEPTKKPSKGYDL